MKPEDYGDSMEIEVGTDLWHMVHGTKQTYALAELKRFQMERELHLRPFDKRVCTMNIAEELLEMHGVNDLDSRLFAKTVAMTISVITWITKVTRWRYKKPTWYDKVDALCDIQTFAGGDVMKIGYDNERCLVETAKEVNSRKGEIIEGKFQKYKTPEAKALWYKADYSECKL